MYFSGFVIFSTDKISEEKNLLRIKFCHWKNVPVSISDGLGVGGWGFSALHMIAIPRLQRVEQSGLSLSLLWTRPAVVPLSSKPLPTSLHLIAPCGGLSLGTSALDEV